MTRRESLKDELKDAVLNGTVSLTLDGFIVMKPSDTRQGGVQIVIPPVSKDSLLHYVVQNLYESARKRRDWVAPKPGAKAPEWNGIEIPPAYWPDKTEGEGKVKTSSPLQKQLIKVKVGAEEREFDLDDPLVKERVWEWAEPILDKKIENRRKSLFDFESNKEFNSLLDAVKPIAGLTADIAVKTAMILPLLNSRGYKQVNELATHLLQLATGEVNEKNLSLLEKVN